MAAKIIDLVEYEPSTRSLRTAKKLNQEYCGIGPAGRYQMTCLTIRSIGATRRHHIEVGHVEALTLAGKRYVLETPWDRWRIRSQELKILLDGECEEWAREYFDPSIPKFFKLAEDYARPEVTTAKSRNERVGTKPTESLIVLSALAALAWWLFS